MLQGHLHQLPKSKKWVVRYMRTPQIITELPVHPNNAYALKKSKHLKPVFFEIETIAIGTSEFDVKDCDVARLINPSLYSLIESKIISWSIDGTKTAGELTRDILELVDDYKK